jgi:hypothetical protein
LPLVQCTLTKSAPRKDHLGVDLISDALPFRRLWYTKPEDAIEYAKHRSRSHVAVIRVYDVGLQNLRSARAMQDGVRLALLHFLQPLTDFRCGPRNDLDTAPFPLRYYFVHYRKRAMGAGSDNEPLTSPGNFFSDRKRCVAELFAELLGRSFLPFPHFAACDHHIMRVALSLDLDFSKFDESCFHFSMFYWLDLQGNNAVIRVFDEAGNVIESTRASSKSRKFLLASRRTFR